MQMELETNKRRHKNASFQQNSSPQCQRNAVCLLIRRLRCDFSPHPFLLNASPRSISAPLFIYSPLAPLSFPVISPALLHVKSRAIICFHKYIFPICSLCWSVTPVLLSNTVSALPFFTPLMLSTPAEPCSRTGITCSRAFFTQGHC